MYNNKSKLARDKMILISTDVYRNEVPLHIL